MSSKLIAGNATNGSSLSADTTGILEIQTGSTPTTAITIDASQNVGIGISPNAAVKLQVKTATNQDLVINSSSFVSGGTAISSVNDAFNAYTPLDIIGTSIQFGTNGLERMRIDSSGNVLIKATSNFADAPTGLGIKYTPSINYGIAIGATSTGLGTAVTFLNSSNAQVGSIKTDNAGTSYNTSSDYRLKENIAPMTGALDAVAQLKPVTYTWKADGSSGQGFIAHELQDVVPDCVTGEKDAVDAEGKPVYQGIDTSFLVATLTAAIQELNAKVTALETQLGAK